jgi:hypothetical protein
MGGCSTYGCDLAPKPTKEIVPQQPLAAWGDINCCPGCGETIGSNTLRCQHCNLDLSTADPRHLARSRVGASEADRLRGVKATTIVLFLLSLIGWLAPVVLVASLVLLSSRGALVARAGPFYKMLGYAAVGVALVDSSLVVLFWVLPD